MLVAALLPFALAVPALTQTRPVHSEAVYHPDGAGTKRHAERPWLDLPIGIEGFGDSHPNPSPPHGDRDALKVPHALVAAVVHAP